MIFILQATSTSHKAVFATVSVTVKDVNDNKPTFLDTPYTGAVLENASLGMTVMRVTAVDKDEVLYFKSSLTLVSSRSYLSYCKISWRVHQWIIMKRDCQSSIYVCCKIVASLPTNYPLMQDQKPSNWPNKLYSIPTATQLALTNQPINSQTNIFLGVTKARFRRRSTASCAESN